MYEYCCGNCQYFRQHYIKFYAEQFNQIPCGHCVYPRLKHRRPDTLACVYYKAKEVCSHDDNNTIIIDDK